MSSDLNYQQIRSDFIEKTGLIKQAEGMPRIAGRVFGMLLFDGELVSFGDLATKLQVSRGSISSSIRLLEERGLVKRHTKPGERQAYFKLADNPYATMLERMKKRNAETRQEIIQTIQSLPSDACVIDRLNSYAQFYASTDAAVGVALKEMSNPVQHQYGQQPTGQKDTTDDN